MLFVLAESHQQARQYFDAMGQELSDDAIVVTCLHEAQGRVMAPDDRVVWVHHDPILEDLFFYLTVTLDSDRRDQLRLQLS